MCYLLVVLEKGPLNVCVCVCVCVHACVHACVISKNKLIDRLNYHFRSVRTMPCVRIYDICLSAAHVI